MDKANSSIKVMIAGIGGASLGTEIYKCLRLAEGYEIYGCDVSETAYGLYGYEFADTYHISRDDYLQSVIEACSNAGTSWLIPGGEEPAALLGAANKALAMEGISLVTNDVSLAAMFSDKEAAFIRLAELGIPIPHTVAIVRPQDIDAMGLPCIIKPATGTGGSMSVFFAASIDEAMVYAEFIRRSGATALAQEYVDIYEGEFTIGVLSLPDRRLVGSIALCRALNAKLSVSYRGRGGLVSSGYSQGYIGEFSDLRRQAERIAAAIGSQGPINIQGRVRDGVLLPFEINPRFSASTYLRALAGFNEVDIFLRYLVSGETPVLSPIKSGWYLRSLTEMYVPEARLK